MLRAEHRAPSTLSELSLHTPLGTADFAPGGAGSCSSPLYPLQCMRKTLQCSPAQQLGHGASPQTLPLHHKTGVQAQRMLQLHPKSLPASTNKPCDS